MSFINRLTAKILGTDIIDSPTFVKEFSTEDHTQLNQLNELLDKVIEDDVQKVEQEIIKLKSGLSGEKNISFELKNSRIPMLIIHDVRLEHKGLQAQFDYILITKKNIIVLESKRMFGNLKVESDGSFIREMNFRGKKVRERMYSPIVQNERHILLLDEILKDNKIIRKIPIESLVVIANEKTFIDYRFAKKEIKEQIVNHDLLIQRLNKIIDECDLPFMSYSQMHDIANFIIENNKPIEYDFISMLNLTLKEEVDEETIDEIEEVIEENDQEVNDLESDLKKYRWNESRKRKIKPYLIFNNKEMEELIASKPLSEEELLKVRGFGEVKVREYGKDIIAIFEKYNKK